MSSDTLRHLARVLRWARVDMGWLRKLADDNTQPPVGGDDFEWLLTADAPGEDTRPVYQPRHASGSVYRSAVAERRGGLRIGPWVDNPAGAHRCDPRRGLLAECPHRDCVKAANDADARWEDQ